MFEIIATAYVQIFAVILPAFVIGLLTIGAIKSGLPKRKAAAAVGIYINLQYILDKKSSNFSL